MAKPRIAMTTWRRTMPTFLDERTDLYTLGAEYPGALARNGAVPLLLGHLDPADVDTVLDAVDGLVLVGGDDIDPVCYGQANGGKAKGLSATADRSDIALARAAHDRGMPTLAICRGMQIVNVAFGGTLHQDLSDPMGIHIPTESTPAAILGHRHEVTITEGTRLAAIYGAHRRIVNSIHHQGIDQVAPGFRVAAVADDGLVEALESTTGWDCTAVQWHPEKLDPADEDPLFASFLERVRSAAPRTLVS